MPAYYPSGATLDIDFTTSTLGGMTFARASTATDGLYTDAAGSSYNTFTTNTPRYSATWGLLYESQARTNYLLNSTAPATQTTGSLGVANHVLWVIGTGSATITAGTGTATGLGTATAGNPVFFSVTGAGTFTVTVSGSLDRFQLEKGGSPTSFIVTAGATATRAAETCTLATGAWFSSTAGTLLAVAAMPYVGTNTTATGVVALDDGTTNNRMTLSQNPNLQFLVTASSVSQFNINIASQVAATGTTFREAFRYSSTDMRHAGNGTLGTAQTGKTIPTVTQLNLVLGAAAQLGITLRVQRLTYWNTALVDSDLQVITTLNAAYGVGAIGAMTAPGTALQEYRFSGTGAIGAMTAIGAALQEYWFSGTGQISLQTAGQARQEILTSGTGLLGPMQASGTTIFQNRAGGIFRLSLLTSVAVLQEYQFAGGGVLGALSSSGFVYQGVVARAVMTMQVTAAAQQEERFSGRGLMTMRAAGTANLSYTTTGTFLLPAMQAAGQARRGYDFSGVMTLHLQATSQASGIIFAAGSGMLGLRWTGTLIQPPPSPIQPAMLTTPWPPSVQSQGQAVSPRSLSAHFRADVSQQVPDGINTFLSTYSAMWDLPWSYSDDLIAFLRANYNRDILWIIPGELSARAWRIKGWQRITPDPDHDQVSVELIERPFL